MLHAHVEALLHHCVFQVDVGAGADLLVRAVLVNIRGQSFQFKSLLLSVKDRHVASHIFGARLLESAGPGLRRSTVGVLWLGAGVDLELDAMLVLSGARNIKLQTLAVEDLIVVETWRSFIESNILTGKHFVVGGSALGSPLRSRVLEVVLHLISCGTQLLRALQHFLRVVLIEGAHFAFDVGALFDS